MIFPAREVAAHVKQLVSRSRFLYPTIHLNRHDWDDLAQTVTLHIMGKWGQHKGDKWKQWVNRVTHNQISNKLRERITAARRMPTSSMTSRLAQLDDTGDEVLVYEPDIAISVDGTDNTRAVIRELDSEDQQWLHLYAWYGSWRKVGEAKGVSGAVARIRGLRAAALVKTMI